MSRLPLTRDASPAERVILARKRLLALGYGIAQPTGDFGAVDRPLLDALNAFLERNQHPRIEDTNHIPDVASWMLAVAVAPRFVNDPSSSRSLDAEIRMLRRCANLRKDSPRRKEARRILRRLGVPRTRPR